MSRKQVRHLVMKCRGCVIAMFAIALLSTGLPLAAAAQETILYSFFYGGSDGLAPYGALTPDGAGNFYGTTTQGGSVGAPFGSDGAVFELSPASGGGYTEKVLYSFGTASGDGIQPAGTLIFDSKGNLYGTATSGGANNNSGTVFELSPVSGGGWTEKTIYNFGATTTDGIEPAYETLIFDAQGNLYGTTLKGGANGDGTVFELTLGTGGTWTEKILYNFGASTADAMGPYPGVIFDAAGNLYGTTRNGGAFGYGTAFELTPGVGGTWTETVLHSFDINGTDGANPESAVILDSQGNLYGTTYYGGNFGQGLHLGAVYELSPTLSGVWTEQVLHSFTGGLTNGDGDYPIAGLTLDAAGNLYGATGGGGVPAVGMVFALIRSGGVWTEEVVYTFSDNTTDGRNPYGSMIFDAAGNLYGTTASGGVNSFGLYGTVYELSNIVTAGPQFSPPGGAYSAGQSVTLTDATAGAVMYYSINGGTATSYTTSISVSGSETISAYALSSGLPQSQTVLAEYQIGTVAATPELLPGAGTYTLPQDVTIIDAAPDATIYYTTNGNNPTTSSSKYSSPITVSSTETIKAMAVAAGYTNSPIASATYTITPLTPPQEKILYSFGDTSSDGGVPYGSLIMDGKGNLYGTTEYGGTHQITYGEKTVSAGTVFELSPASGGGWTEKILYDFGATSTDAALPVAGLAIDSKGNLYGTTFAGGTCDLGTVFELSSGTGGAWTEQLLHSFGCTLTDGEVPDAGLIFDAKGNLYGTTEAGGAYDTTFGGASNGYGTVFELSPGTGTTWTEQVLYSFSYLSQTDGYYPVAPLVFDSKGNLYGTAMDGGSGQDLDGGGAVFELSPAGTTWTEKVLYSFGGGATTGYRILGGVVLDAAGNIYGTAVSGGNGFGLDGTLFELSPVGNTWIETVLHSFGAFEGDGINPESTLVFDSAGNLYGTTYAGGVNGYGTVFELMSQAGGGWTDVVLHSFNLSSTDGANPYVGVILDGNNNLYGTTGYGGPNGGSTTGTTGGTVFEIESGQTGFSLSVTPAGTGSGTVSSSPSGISCPSTCSANFASGTVVTLTAAVGSGSTFAGWSGACTGTGTCSVTMSAAKSVTATFNATVTTFALSVTLAGTGAGTVSSSPTGISCPSTCSANFNSGAVVTLTEVVGSGSTFAGWSGACTGTGTCSVTMSAAKSVTATFNATVTTFALSVTLAGTGAGTVSSSPTGISCPSTCSANFNSGAVVTLTEVVGSGSTFAGWSGACTGTGTCSVTMSAAKSVTATFNSSSSPAVTLTPTSLNFGTVATGVTSPVKTVTLKNSGKAALTITSIAITGTDVGDFPETTTCTGSLAANATCLIKVQFKPAAVGARSAAVSITDNAVGSPQQVPLSGTGTTAKLSPASLAFGTWAVGLTSTVDKVTLTNVGTTALTITSIAVTGAEAADFPQTATTCGGSLAAAASCTVSMTFKPSTTGARSADLTFTDSASGSPQLVALSGTGTTVELTPRNLSFGTLAVGLTSAAKTVTLKNLGTTATTITSIAVTGAEAGDFPETATTCGGSLAAAASCTVSVTFKPSTTGARSATLKFTDSASGSPQAVPLTGTGTTAELSSTSLSFGSVTVGSTAVNTLTLKNVGTTAITITSFTFAGADPGDFAESNDCGNSLAAGVSCTITVTFKPNKTGALSATLKIADSAAGSPQQVTLSGTGS